jgi:hypothetical protein
MNDYCPGAVQVPQKGGVTLDRSLPPRFVWHITWDALKPDGSQPQFSAVANYLKNVGYCPHIMWNPFTGYMEQYYPASQGGRAMAYNNQDGAACIQVEVFFTPGCVVDGVRYNTVAETPLKGLDTLLAWGDSLGVPRTWPLGSPQWQGNSRDAGVWNTRAGHYGHCHSPGDTHTDPGPMPDITASTITTQSATITPTQEEDIMASIGDLKNTLLDPEVLEAIGKAVHTRPVPYFDPETGQDTGTGTNLAVLAGASDFQHSATRRVLASAAGAIVDAVKAAQPQDAANVAQAAYDEFMKKLDATTLKVGVK